MGNTFTGRVCQLDFYPDKDVFGGIIENVYAIIVLSLINNRLGGMRNEENEYS